AAVTARNSAGIRGLIAPPGGARGPSGIVRLSSSVLASCVSAKDGEPISSKRHARRLRSAISPPEANLWPHGPFRVALLHGTAVALDQVAPWRRLCRSSPRPIDSSAIGPGIHSSSPREPLSA